MIDYNLSYPCSVSRSLMPLIDAIALSRDSSQLTSLWAVSIEAICLLNQLLIACIISSNVLLFDLIIISNAHISLNFKFIKFGFTWLWLCGQCFFSPNFREDLWAYVVHIVISKLEFPLETLATLSISMSEPSLLHTYVTTFAASAWFSSVFNSSAWCSSVFNRWKTHGWASRHWVHSLAEAELERGPLTIAWWFVFLQWLCEAGSQRLFQDFHHFLLLCKLLQLPLGIALAAMD